MKINDPSEITQSVHLAWQPEWLKKTKPDPYAESWSPLGYAG